MESFNNKLIEIFSKSWVRYTITFLCILSGISSIYFHGYTFFDKVVLALVLIEFYTLIVFFVAMRNVDIG